MAVRLLALLSVLNVVSQPTCADASPPFAERVALAKEVEAQKAAAEYLDGTLFPAIGPSLAAAMRACLAHAGASTAKFTVVADVTPDGEFVNVAHQPDTDTAACLAAALASLHTPPPPTCERGDLPIVIDMAITP